MTLLDYIDGVGVTDNRTGDDVAYSKPTAVKLTKYDGVGSFGVSYTNHRLSLELKEGYTVRLDITKVLYDSLSETKIDGDDDE